MKSYAILILSLVTAWTNVAGAASSDAAPVQKLIIPASAFNPASRELRYFVAAGGLGELCTIGGSGYFLATAMLPPGAVVRSIRARVIDRNVNSFAVLSLFDQTAAAGPMLIAFTAPSRDGLAETQWIESEPLAQPVGDTTFTLHVMLSGPQVCFSAAEVLYSMP